MSPTRGGYELGLGALTWVKDSARVDDEALPEGFGTGFGDEDGLWLARSELPVGGDSESDPLSHASSSPQPVSGPEKR